MTVGDEQYGVVTEGRGAPSLISVVVPVLNAEQTLPEVLAALSCQGYRGAWEVIIALDASSVDACPGIARRWAEREPRARVVETAGGTGGARVRNAGVRASRGDFIAFCDADDAAHPDWLSGLASVAPHADLLSGRNDYERLNRPLVRSWHPDRPRERSQEHLGFLPFASGANVAAWRDVLEALGGFDESTASGEDVDLSWRAHLASYRLRFAADAVVHYRFRPTLRGLAAQYYKYGKGNAWLFARHASAGMPSSGLGVGLRRWWVVLRGVGYLRSSSYRGRWVRLVALSAGRIVGSVRHRTLYL